MTDETRTAANARDPLDVLRECRQANWNRWYDLPGRDVADVVLHIDQALGQPSRWLARFKERFPSEWTDELQEALDATA